MLGVSEIKKGNGIDGLLRDITPGRVEDERTVGVIGESRFRDLLDIFEGYLGSMHSEPYTKRQYTNRLSSYVLTPLEINALLQSTSLYETNKAYCWQTGRFLEVLIQNSFKAGYNDFTLTVGNFPEMYGLATGLEGKRSRKLVLNIEGDVSSHIAFNSRHLEISFFGDVISWHGCEGIRDSTVIAHGYVASYFGYDAKNSTFILHGESEQGGFAGGGSEKCTFKTTNEQTLSNLIADVPEFVMMGPDYPEIPWSYTRNKIVYIHPDGKEETVKEMNRLWQVKQLFK